MFDFTEVKELVEENMVSLQDPQYAELVKQAAQTLHNNQECYVAQWILHNQDKNPNDYMLVNEWREDGFGYNFYMVRRENVNV